MMKNIKQKMISSSIMKLEVFLWSAVLLNLNVLVNADAEIRITRPNVEEVSVLPGGDLTFVCESSEPVSWKPFKNFNGELNTRQTETKGKNLPFGSILDLKSITYEYVGYYYCATQQVIDSLSISWDEELKNSPKIYVFVEDYENKLADAPNPIITANIGEEVLIPCKPTSLSFGVQLLKEGHEIDQKRYDPHEGYIVGDAKREDMYTCENVPSDGNHKMFMIDATSHVVLPKPYISSVDGNYAIEGDEIELHCIEKVPIGVKFAFKWTLPDSDAARNEGRFELLEQFTNSTASQVTYIDRIKIRNVDKEDSGLYTCIVDSGSGSTNDYLHEITVVGKDESVINIKEPNDQYRLEVSSKANRAAQWFVDVTGHPKPKSFWLDKDGKEIVSNHNTKCEVTNTDGKATLSIRNPDISDSGDYTLVAFNDKTRTNKTFKLVVKVVPIVKLSDVYLPELSIANLTCEVIGYPQSTIKWKFKPCFNGDCEEQQISDNEIKTDKRSQNGRLAQYSHLSFKPTQSGIVTCQARNTEGPAESNANIVFGDMNDDFMVWGINSEIAEGDRIVLTCGASKYRYSPIEWYYNSDKLVENQDVTIRDESTDLSYRQTLEWISIKRENAGSYECRALHTNNTLRHEVFYVDVRNAFAPLSTENSMSETTQLSLGEPIQFKCPYIGMPQVTTKWYKNNKEIILNEKDPRISFHDKNTILEIKYVKAEDEGKYQCAATNRLGTGKQETNLKISNIPSVSKGLIIGIVMLIIVLSLISIYLCLRVRRERKLLKELRAAGLAHFEEGEVDRINPDLTLDEQADLLPYDRKYEFPKEKLKLGKQLGAGAYGVVVKAHALGILPHEEETTVAVKMVKPTADNEVMRALVSELKIMVHIGQHLNVVNLLGAVTKNVAKREMMVIVEYCRFGNLQNFLVKHRDHFVDQIIRERDIIDPSIQTKEQRWSNDSGYVYNSLKNDSRRPLSAGSAVNSEYQRQSNYFPGGMDSTNTETMLIPQNMQDDQSVASVNSEQPAWRSNYKMDYHGPTRDVTTSDLLCWSFQVARGMDYLASRRVLHGDLAARNILLCDDNVVKICDFGLARSILKTDNYTKKHDAMLPFKWLAIESISDRVFNTHTDVWSFGIVLWELFTLGKVPYPGMSADEELYFKLKNGYRMEKPSFATQDIYDIMLQSWSANPESRPSFEDLTKNLSKLMENGLAEHYIDLNEPYMKVNATNFTDGQTDYLAMMAVPDCQAPPVPLYVNGNVSPKDTREITTNGLNDHKINIDGVSAPNHLNINQSPFRNRRNNPDIPEEIPMLNRSNKSDSETEFNNINEDKTNQNSYINVPSTIGQPKNSVSNPTYVVVENINETRK